ncbi:MAG: peroxiredoxin family protein, partial [Planctomycetota bacterium]
MSAVPHLNELDKKYRARGFEIMNVTNVDSAAALKKFVAKHEITFGVIRSDDIKNFKFSGYPTSWAVGLDGKVLWKGHPSNLKDEMVEKWLENVPQPKITQEYGKALKGAVEAYNEGEYGKAFKEASKCKEKADENAENADKVLAVINRRIELSDKRVKACREAGEIVHAGTLLEELAKGFKGCDAGDSYAKAAKDLTKS